MLIFLILYPPSPENSTTRTAIVGKANILQLRAHGDTAYTTIESRTLFDICKKIFCPLSGHIYKLILYDQFLNIFA